MNYTYDTSHFAHGIGLNSIVNVMVFKYDDCECKANLLFFGCSLGNRIKDTTRYNHVWLKKANWGGCVYPPLLSSRLLLSVQIQIDQMIQDLNKAKNRINSNVNIDLALELMLLAIKENL